MKPDALTHVVFPLAEYTKDEVRAIAEEQGFVNADKKDSTGICFIGDIDYREFIQQHIEAQPGDIETVNGATIGTHEGLHLFTLGQRKGIDIGGDGPYYVVAKDRERNVLVVTNDAEDERLYATECEVNDVHWLQDVELPLECDVQIRYRQEPQSATIERIDDTCVRMRFLQPQRAATPGQAAVLYKDNFVLGGGTIDTVSS